MTKYELAKWYGESMQRFGENYYNPKMRIDNPYTLLVKKPEFQALDEKDKKTILAYGNEMQAYGMGCDVDKLVLQNPFQNEEEKE